MRYTRDGGVVSAGIPMSPRTYGSQHYSYFALKKGYVADVVYPEDPRSTSKSYVEYIVNVGGQNYLGARDIRIHGAIYDYHERIRKIAEKSFSNKDAGFSNFPENLDAEVVYVLFLEGSGDLPVIIGSATHPRNSRYRKASKSQGKFDIQEYNGVEIGIDKNSNYTVTQVGRKNPEGKVLNPECVGSMFRVYGNGDFELNAFGNDDLKIRGTKASKKIEIFAQNNKIVMDSAGIKIEEKGGAIGTFKNGKVAFGKNEELLDLFDQTLQQIIDTETAITQITVPTMMGVSGTPLNSGTFNTIKGNLNTIKTKLNTIKGLLL
jgi:hypothetical protein